MRGAIIAILLVLGLFIFGCAGPQTAANNTSNVSGGNQGTGANGSGTATGPGGQVKQPPPQPPVNSSGGGSATGGSGQTGGGTNLNGMGFAALLALGVPVQCDINSTVRGKTTSMKMYVNGKGVTRIEVPDPSSTTCNETIMVMNGQQQFYMGCASGQLFKGCDWMMFEATPTSGTGGSATGGVQAPDLNSTPATDFSCQPWVLDQSKFTTPGKVCNLKDMMGGSGYP